MLVGVALSLGGLFVDVLSLGLVPALGSGGGSSSATRLGDDTLRCQGHGPPNLLHPHLGFLFGSCWATHGLGAVAPRLVIHFSPPKPFLLFYV